MTTLDQSALQKAREAFIKIEAAWLKRGPIHGPEWPDDALKAAILAYEAARPQGQQVYRPCDDKELIADLVSAIGLAHTADGDRLDELLGDEDSLRNIALQITEGSDAIEKACAKAVSAALHPPAVDEGKRTSPVTQDELDDCYQRGKRD